MRKVLRRIKLLRTIKRWALNRFTGSVYSVDTDSPAVALTFDDGPNRFTPSLLSCLADHGARVTFFMLGEAAARYPGIVDDVEKHGHDVANHSWNHPSFPRISFAECRRQIAETERAIRYNRHRLFRPPFGHQSHASYLAAKSFGLKIIAWNSFARDWHDDDAETLVQRVAKDLSPGNIVLLHDYLHDVYELRFLDRAPTIEAVDKLLARNKTSYEFVPVSELLRRGHAIKQPWFERGRDDFLDKLIVTAS